MTETKTFKSQEEAVDFMNNPGAPFLGMYMRKVSDKEWLVQVDWK